MNKQNKEKLQVFFLALTLFFLLILIIINVAFLILPDTNPINYAEKQSAYNYYINKYNDDIEVTKVVNKCNNSDLKVECVYNSIYFDWTRRDKSNLFSPTELVNNEGHGLCRDISVFRKAVLNKLNIESIFVFKPNHVYVVAFEDDKIYELNNEKIKER